MIVIMIMIIYLSIIITCKLCEMCYPVYLYSFLIMIHHDHDHDHDYDHDHDHDFDHDQDHVNDMK